jgi:hypothetical protein
MDTIWDIATGYAMASRGYTDGFAKGFASAPPAFNFGGIADFVNNVKSVVGQASTVVTTIETICEWVCY